MKRDSINKKNSFEQTHVTDPSGKRFDSLTDSNDSDTSSTSYWLSQTERKFLSKLAHKKVARLFVDDREKLLLANLRKAIIQHTNNSKKADNLIQSALKLCLKIGLLDRNDDLSNNNLIAIENFRVRFHSAMQTAITFYEVDFKFNRDSLKNILRECKRLAHLIIEGHLSNNSHESIDKIFSYLIESDFIECFFDKNHLIYKTHTQPVMKSIKEMVENDLI